MPHILEGILKQQEPVRHRRKRSATSIETAGLASSATPVAGSSSHGREADAAVAALGQRTSRLTVGQESDDADHASQLSHDSATASSRWRGAATSDADTLSITSGSYSGMHGIR